MLAQAQECAWQRAVAGTRHVSRQNPVLIQLEQTTTRIVLSQSWQPELRRCTLLPWTRCDQLRLRSATPFHQ